MQIGRDARRPMRTPKPGHAVPVAKFSVEPRIFGRTARCLFRGVQGCARNQRLAASIWTKASRHRAGRLRSWIKVCFARWARRLRRFHA